MTVKRTTDLKMCVDRKSHKWPSQIENGSRKVSQVQCKLGRFFIPLIFRDLVVSRNSNWDTCLSKNSQHWAFSLCSKFASSIGMARKCQLPDKPPKPCRFPVRHFRAFYGYIWTSCSQHYMSNPRKVGICHGFSLTLRYHVLRKWDGWDPPRQTFACVLFNEEKSRPAKKRSHYSEVFALKKNIWKTIGMLRPRTSVLSIAQVLHVHERNFKIRTRSYEHDG